MEKSRHRPLWISHRGRGQTYFENSREALTEALSSGFDAIEVDLRMSKDRHLVLYHDPHLGALSLPSQSIESLTKSELQQLHGPKGERLFFFDDFAKEFAGTEWTLDIKPESAALTVEWLIAFFKEHSDQLAKTRFLFWRPQDEERFLHEFETIRSYARFNECLRAGLCSYFGLDALGKIKAKRIYSLTARHYGLELFRRRIVESYHKRGAKVLAYLPEEPRDFEAAVEAGFDEILSDFDPRFSLGNSQ